MTSPLTPFSNYFNLIKEDGSTVRSDPPHSGGPFGDVMAYGGLLVSQAVNSLTSLDPKLLPHTVNYKFIAPVKTTIPLQYKVNSYEDSNVASVSVSQKGNVVGMGHIQFGSEPDFLDSSHSVCPDYGPPSDYPAIREFAKTVKGGTSTVMENMSELPLHIKVVESPLYPNSDEDRTSFWVKLKPILQRDAKPADGLIVLLFISDFLIVQVAGDIYHKADIMIMAGASMHHSVWIHDGNLDPYGWYLTVTECHVISYGRVRLESKIFNQDRKCVMTVVQEAYMQRATEDKAKI